MKPEKKITAYEA